MLHPQYISAEEQHFISSSQIKFSKYDWIFVLLDGVNFGLYEMFLHTEDVIDDDGAKAH